MNDTQQPQPTDAPEKVACPFCDGTDTQLFSPFGSQLSVSTYWCNHCHTAFEKMKSVRKAR